MEVTRSSIYFITREQLHATQEHQEISPLRFAPVEMTKEGTREQLHGTQEHQEISPLRFAPVEMTKGRTREQLYGSQEYEEIPSCTALRSE